MKSFLPIIFVLAVIQLAAQPSQFDFPTDCDASPLEEEQFIGEVKINGANASVGDFVALFDDGGNVMGVGAVIEVDLGSGLTTGASFPAITQPVADGDCPANYGGNPGEFVDIVLWDASAGVFLTTAAGGFTFNTSFGLVTGTDGLPFTADLYNFIMLFAPLPVQFTYFRGSAQNEDVLLEWATALEVDNDYFAVEHSTDGRTFERIGQVHGNGTQVALHEYDFTHENAGRGIHYYRLQQYDFDGATSYSQLITVTLDEGDTADGTANVYPNPTTGEVRVDVPAQWVTDSEVTIYVRDLNGRVLQKQQLANSPTLYFDINGLPNGLLILEMNNGETTLVERVIKM